MLTLAEAAQLEKDNLRGGILQTLVEVSPYLTRLPTESIGALSLSYMSLTGIPRARFRLVNEAPPAQERATWAERTVSLHILDRDIDIDPVILASKNWHVRPDVAQTRAVVEGISYTVVDMAFNGNPLMDVREPPGIRFYLENDPLFEGMTVNATSTAVELNCIPGSATDTNYLTMLHRLDQTIATLGSATQPNLSDTVLVTSPQAVLALWAALRQLKLLDITRDQFDREIMRYRGVAIIDAGFKPEEAVSGRLDAAGQGVRQVIGNDADAPTGPGVNAYDNTTPIYAVRFGADRVMLLQQEALRTKEFGEVHEPPHYFRVNVRWVFAPTCPYQRRSLARLVGCAFSVTPA